MAAPNCIGEGLSAMKTSNKVFTQRAVAVSCAAVIAAALLSPVHCLAWTTRSTYYYNWSNYDHGDTISAAEEARREKGREKRRDELAEERAENTQAFLDSQAAIRASSRAASRAPRDAFYRKPGTTADSLPPGSAAVEVSGEKFHYSRGIFYKEIAGKYLVVPAPVGAVVDSLPEGHAVAAYQGDFETYSYYFGAFFKEENGKFTVVAPPAGTIVGYIPDGYTETKVDETTEYQFGAITFRGALWQGNTVYEVVGI